MKVAFCLHGISFGRNFKNGGLPVTFRRECELYKKHFINLVEQCDVYFHTWKHDSVNELTSMYQPKNTIIEEPRVFKRPTLVSRMFNFRRKLLYGRDELFRKNNVYSRWYSFKRAAQLALESPVKYDYIFVGRFDMSMINPFPIESLKQGMFYVGDWVKWMDCEGEAIPAEEVNKSNEKRYKKQIGFPFTDEGFHDFWFLASPDLMREFSKVYDELSGLMGTSGVNSHRCTLKKLEYMNVIPKVTRLCELYKDYNLTRWI